MTKQKPAFQVTPVTAEETDIQSSLIGERIMEYLWREIHMRNKLIDVLLWSRICGAGFWKVYWDSSKGKQVTIVADQEGKPVMDETGAPMRPEHFEGEQLPEGLQKKMIATGEVAVETVSPFEFLPDPIPNELEDCEWCIQQSVKSPEWVKKHYGVEVEPDTDVSPGPAESRLFPSFQMGGTTGYRGVKLHEYWCKPNSDRPNGRYAVWARGKMLYQGDNVYKCLPYLMFKGIPASGRFWPTSVVEQLRGPQTELNKIRSQITESAQRMGNPAIMTSRQAKIVYQGAPGERIDYDSTVPDAVPQYLTPPGMPAYVLQQQERIEQSIQEISGQHEVSGAQVPAGVTAASAINLLQEADDTRLGPAIYDMEETLGEAGSRLLTLIAQYWTDERAVTIAGEDHAWDIMNFRGSALKANTHVEVQSGSMFPQSKAAKQAAIQQVLTLFVQNSGGIPPNPRVMRKVLKDLEAGGLEKLFGDLSQDEPSINRENGQLAQGVPVEVNPFDNHQLHIEGHTEMQKSAPYQSFPPPVQQMVENHVMEHRERLLEAMTPPQPVEAPQASANGGPPSGQPQPMASLLAQ